MVGSGLPTRDQRSVAAGQIVGNAEAAQDPVQAIGELPIQRVVQMGQPPRYWGGHSARNSSMLSSELLTTPGYVLASISISSLSTRRTSAASSTTDSDQP